MCKEAQCSSFIRLAYGVRTKVERWVGGVGEQALTLARMAFLTILAPHELDSKVSWI